MVRMYAKFLVFGDRKLFATTRRYHLVYGSRKRKHFEVEVCKVHEIVANGK
jgi:hypothetical protein